MTIPKPSYSVELEKFGVNPESKYPSELDSIVFKIYEDQTLLTQGTIVKSDFSTIFQAGFIEDGDILRSEVLKLDTANQKLLITNMFGLPNSDSHLYDAIYIVDFEGKFSLISASYSCYPNLRLRGNLISTCNGVYDYNGEIFIHDSCCTVFSCLMNDSTYFFISDKLDGQIIENNAVFVGLLNQDTIRAFTYEDYTYSIGFSSLMWYSDELNLLTFIQLEDSILTTVNSNLEFKKYDINELAKDPNLKRNLTDLTYMYSIEIMNEPIITRFNIEGKPIAIKL